jgi:hypothetical protein
MAYSTVSSRAYLRGLKTIYAEKCAAKSIFLAK